MADAKTPRADALPAKVSFVLPEEAFTPIVFKASVLRQNDRGMLIAISDVPGEYYRKLLADKRCLRLRLKTELSRKEQDHDGLVQWLDFHKNGATGELNVGFEFVTGSSKEDLTTST